jgi:hypothetical protein
MRAQKTKVEFISKLANQSTSTEVLATINSMNASTYTKLNGWKEYLSSSRVIMEKLIVTELRDITKSYAFLSRAFRQKYPIHGAEDIWTEEKGNNRRM